MPSRRTSVRATRARGPPRASASRVVPYETRSLRSRPARETRILATITGNDAGDSIRSPAPPGRRVTLTASRVPSTASSLFGLNRTSGSQNRRRLYSHFTAEPTALTRAVDRAIGHLARQLANNDEFLSRIDVGDSVREVGQMFSRQRTNYFVAVRFVLSSILAMPMDDPLDAIMRVATSLDRYIFDPLVIPPLDEEDIEDIASFLANHRATSGSSASRSATGRGNRSSSSRAAASSVTEGVDADIFNRFNVRMPDAFPIVRVRGFNIPGLRQQYEESLKWRKWFDVLRDRALKDRQKSGKSSKDNDCPICLDTLDGVTKLQPITCIHVFHEECIDNWIKKNPAFPHARCPVCRGDFMSKEALDRKNRNARNGRESGESSEQAFTVAYRILPID